MTAPPIFVRSDDAAYRANALAEASFWAADQQAFGIEATSRGDGQAEIHRYENLRFTGSPKLRWFEELPRFGPFMRGLALGTSGIEQDAAMLKSIPSLRLHIIDISQSSVDRWQRELGARFPDRVTSEVADLNFIQLEEARFDFVVSSSTMHHITNLEHLACQINGALTPDGYFFLQDYAGESRYRFSAEKRRVFEALYARDLQRRPGRPPDLEWTSEDDGGYSPFCAVRSEATLPVMANYLQPEKVRTAGALLFPMLMVRPAGTPGASPLRTRLCRAARRRVLRVLRQPVVRLDRRYVRELMFIGDLLADAGVILPGNAYGVYRKRIEPSDDVRTIELPRGTA